MALALVENQSPESLAVAPWPDYDPYGSAIDVMYSGPNATQARDYLKWAQGEYPRMFPHPDDPCSLRLEPGASEDPTSADHQEIQASSIVQGIFDPERVAAARLADEAERQERGADLLKEGYQAPWGMDGNDSQSGRYASTASGGYVNDSPVHATYKGDIMGELYIDGLPASERVLMPVHMPPIQTAREHKRRFFSKKRVSSADRTEEVTAIYPTEVVPVVVDKPEKRDDGNDLFVHDELAARRAQRRERQERVTGRLRKIGAVAGAAAVAALLFVGVGNTNRDEERISAEVPLTTQDIAPAPTTTTTVRSTTSTTIIRGSLNSNHAPITRPAYEAPSTTTTTKKPTSPTATANTAPPGSSTTGPAPTTTGKPTTSTTRLPVSSTIRPQSPGLPTKNLALLPLPACRPTMKP